MLGKIQMYDFNINKIEVKTSKQFAKLVALNPKMTDQRLAIEIIPYEQLWEEVLVGLK